jgi:hypothetical protein
MFPPVVTVAGLEPFTVIVALINISDFAIVSRARIANP